MFDPPEAATTCRIPPGASQSEGCWRLLFIETDSLVSCIYVTSRMSFFEEYVLDVCAVSHAWTSLLQEKPESVRGVVRETSASPHALNT